MFKVLRRIWWKCIVLKVIQILLISQFVLAQSISNSDSVFQDKIIDDKTFDDLGNIDTNFIDVKAQEIKNKERYEFKERAEFKQSPDFGPDYKNKDEMLFGKLFSYIEDDINKFDLMKYCSDPNKIADVVIGKVKDKIGAISNVCGEIEEHESECKKRVEEDCSRMGQPDASYARDEREKLEILANSCPVDEGKIKELCILNSREWIDDRLQYLEEDCGFEWERYGSRNQDCDRIESECNKDAYVNDCMERHKPFEQECQKIMPPQCDGRLEEKYNDRGCLVEYHCIEECPISHEEANRIENDCYRNNGNPERVWEGDCISDVICRPKCPISEDEALRLENDCYRNNGNPEKVWDGDCISEVRCNHEQQCPLTDEEANRKEQECMGNNGVPEKVFDGNCITEVRCEIQPQCPMSEEEVQRQVYDCANKGGNPEKIMDNNCIREVICHVDTTATDNPDNSITGNVVRISGAFTYEQAKEECTREWNYKTEDCKRMKENCDKNKFVEQCAKREKENVEFDLKNAERQCERDAKMQAKHRERDCLRMEADRQRCFDDGTRRCGMQEGLSGDCRNQLTEDNFRNFIIKEAEKKCKFVPFMKEKDFSKYDEMEIVLAVLDTVGDEEISKLESVVRDLHKKFEIEGKIIFAGMINPNQFKELKRFNFVVDAKLNAPESSDMSKERKESIISRLDPERVVEKLLELRDTDVSSEYKYLIEDEASDILDVSDDLNELSQSEESKGLGYKIKLFLGFAKDMEENEVKQLEASMQRLETSIASLSKLAEQVPDDIAASILKAQVEELERQKADIDDLIKSKEKKAKGLLQLFGLFG